MSRASVVRILLGCVMGAAIGGMWSAIDGDHPFGAYLLVLLWAIAAYVVAWPIGDDR